MTSQTHNFYIKNKHVMQQSAAGSTLQRSAENILIFMA